MNDRNRFGFSPVKVGEELDVKIDAVGEKGDGLARKDGFVLFVPGVKEGDEVRIRVTKVLRKVGFAEVIGKAEGSVGANESQTDAAPAADEEPAAPEDDLDLSGENDTEDFGEESTSDEEPADEEPADEEPADEEPADEEPADEEPADEEPAEEDSDKKKKD